MVAITCNLHWCCVSGPTTQTNTYRCVLQLVLCGGGCSGIVVVVYIYVVYVWACVCTCATLCGSGVYVMVVQAVCVCRGE